MKIVTDNKEKNIETTDKEKIEEIIKEEKLVKKLNSETLQIKEDKYRIKTNYREALDLELLEERYSDLLEKYDYIVGDMSYGKLRLRGFYNDSDKKAPIDMKIAHLDDYLLEYCSFGCAYFVLESLETKQKNRSYANTETDFKSSARPSQKRKSDKNKKKPYKKNKNDKTKSSNPPAPKKKKPFTKKSRTDKKVDKQQDKNSDEKVKNIKNEKGNTRFQIRKKK